MRKAIRVCQACFTPGERSGHARRSSALAGFARSAIPSWQRAAEEARRGRAGQGFR